MSIIVKWSSGIACDWCESLDIAYMLALKVDKGPNKVILKIVIQETLSY